MWALLFSIISGYLIGSISFGIIAGKVLRGIDIRNYGSGNTGGTNVLRVLGKKPAAVVLAGDVLKGAASVAAGFYIGDISCAVLGGAAAIAGHTYPLYFGFRGGKGAATGFGVILALVPDATVIALVIFVLTIMFTRYVSLGSILGAASVPVSVFLLDKPLSILVFSICAASFVIYRHRSNIVRLYKGQENKLRW
ncbi:MAG: glycerol-3-phosphate 1-O-acyltransferase PlsY [Peptococcaceae bacterium]|jgi:glycerol-3-phosphate acyltransferase PlsY|nr:glycerol-3-phosphate 1-O-acyltransferase PlsY [Peptococcaceae bacterium]MDH7525238.1 glycerol-3-phosphate 1-O-acyltransferase PlsY [Peptococcaceae bacterium]